MSSWTFKGKPFNTTPDAFGFLYLITNTVTKQKYVGKKQFNQYLTKKVKGKKNRVHFTKPSDWLNYWSSCQELKNDIKTLGKDQFTREILSVHQSKGALSYAEVECQFKRDVLHKRLACGRYAYYNQNIMSHFFRPK